MSSSAADDQDHGDGRRHAQQRADAGEAGQFGQQRAQAGDQQGRDREPGPESAEMLHDELACPLPVVTPIRTVSSCTT